MTRRWFALTSGLVLSTTLAASAMAQDSTTGHSFFGNWLGWRDGASSQQTNKMNQSGNGSGGPQASSRYDQMPPDPATSQNDVLPGLGGTPLPRNGAQKTANGSLPKNAATPNAPSQAPTARRNAVRQLDISAPGAAPATNPPASAARQSPVHRTTPHVNSNNLRNELSGSFSSPPTTSQSATGARVADERASTPRSSPALEKPAKKEVQAIVEPKREVTGFEREPHNAAEAFGATIESHANLGASSFVRTPYSNALPAGPQTTRGKEAFGEALQVASGGDPNVLASNQTPILNADIRGPKQILIGREALYRIRLQNQSEVPAEGIVATVRVPSGCDVTNATGSQGVVQQLQDSQAKGQLQWQISRLDRHAAETLELRVIPHESRPLELGITWTTAPVGSRAVVEVQEPKLQLEITGPAEVYFDKPQLFKLTISNPGTGPAENVKIDLMPPGTGKDSDKAAVTSHPLGDLLPGGSQTVEVELTAREAGKIFIKAIASSEGGLVCNAAKEVFCRKPELEVDWRGPATKYAGTMATYFLRVRNPGTAPADDVTVRATLPEGAEFTSASEGQLFDTKQHEVVWHVGTLRPGDDNYMELKCVLKTAGTNQLKITAATAAGNLSDSKTAATNVIALADLKLNVVDPSGPIAVGSPAVYEIHIKNRGSSSAKDVTVVGLFSEGLEPEQAEGAMYSVADGRVSFKTIENLPAGRDVELRIRAHAIQQGTHIFRAEVLCRDLEIKLATEETTRFYTDDTAPVSGKPEKQAAGGSEAFRQTVR